MVVNWIDARATIVSDWDDSRMIIACEIGAEARERKNREQQLHTAFARNLAACSQPRHKYGCTDSGRRLVFMVLGPITTRLFLEGKITPKKKKKNHQITKLPKSIQTLINPNLM
jgi:hypothetical protein